MPLAAAYFVRSMVGRFWRVSMRPTGPSSCCMAIFHASTVSLASAGRRSVKFGVARSMARCSMGWCVGPSSPTPMLSCVST